MGALKLSYNEHNISVNDSDYSFLMVVAKDGKSITPSLNSYVFGAPMPGRNFSSSGYRYGFNGKENDPETSTQDYGMRIYNPNLGRFLSCDPLFKSFAYKTVYDFAENSPIMGIDLDGGELEFFMFAKTGLFGQAAQQIARDIDKGAAKSCKKFAMGLVQTGRLTGGQATNKEYVNAVVGITAQTLYVQTPGANKVIANNLSKSKNGALNAVGNGMKALAKEEADVNKAFKEGNTEKIAEVVTDVGILVATMVITEGITAYATPAEAAMVADELTISDAIGAAPKGFSKLNAKIEKIIGSCPANPDAIIAGCENVAKKLQKLMGGEFLEVRPPEGYNWLGDVKYDGGTKNAPQWGHHVAVEKNGMVYDKMTGSGGLSRAEYESMFEEGVEFKNVEKTELK